MSEYLDLYDYRCQVAALYQEREQASAAGEDEAAILLRFRAAKDALFRQHPQSALNDDQRRTFQGLRYFAYNPALRFTVAVDTTSEPTRQAVVMNASESMTMTTVGRVQFTIGRELVTLSLYWLEIYGGGLFLPFRDLTCPTESYGGGRYLFDTIKGSVVFPACGSQGWKSILLDFNYAYNPSCAYNHRWVCPLAPLENRLQVPIQAGEMNYTA